MKELIEEAIAFIREHEPRDGNGYHVAFSGGKDSCVILELCKMSGVKFEASFSPTSLDPKEVLTFIKQYHPEVKWQRPTTSMRKLLLHKGIPPSRRMRYCCGPLKEFHSKKMKQSVDITGVRACESSRRKQRERVTINPNNHKKEIYPIFNWSDEQVWQFIHDHNLPFCSLYLEGFKRIGCSVVCPMTTTKNRLHEAERFPHIANIFKKACNDAYEKHKDRGLRMYAMWDSGEDMWNWWMTGKKKGSLFK